MLKRILRSLKFANFNYQFPPNSLQFLRNNSLESLETNLFLNSLNRCKINLSQENRAAKSLYWFLKIGINWRSNKQAIYFNIHPALNCSGRSGQTWMNERMNERLVNHSSRKFKVASYDTERSARLYRIVRYQEHAMHAVIWHLLLQTRGKGQSPRSSACRGKGNALAGHIRH